MSLKTDDKNKALTHKDLVFILAIAGRIDVQSKILAKEINEDRHVYYAYSVLDSLSSSYSMFKYFFDVYFAGSADKMHDFMLTPAGVAGITLETIFLVGFSLFSCHFDNEKENKYIKQIAEAWPFFRNVIKGLKNAYKGWRSTVSALGLLGIVDAKHLIMPVGVILGIFAAANRFIMRTITEARKKMMAHNAELLLTLSRHKTLTAKETELLLKKTPIKSQTIDDQCKGYLGSAFGGTIDSLYLYMGVLTLAAFAPPLLIALSVICVFYTIACIITRVYEEYDYQQRLKISQTKCYLVIYTKQIQTTFAKLTQLEGKADKTEQDLLAIQAYKMELHNNISQFETHRSLLIKQSERSYFVAILFGLKNGLFAYSALSSVLFLISGFLVMGGVSCPPIFIAVVAVIGLAIIAGFITHSLVNKYKSNKNPDPIEKANEQEFELMLNIKKQIEEKPEEGASLTLEQLNDSLKAGLSVKSAPAYFFQEWFEIFRSLFSGFSKGQKFVDFAANPLQEKGADGHFHDSPVMHVLGSLSALLFGFILALRALARGFGRPSTSIGGEEELSAAVKPLAVKNEDSGESIIQQPVQSEPEETYVEGESVQTIKRNDSPEKSRPLLSLFGFFKEKPSAALTRARSENEFNNLLIEPNTIQGLA